MKRGDACSEPGCSLPVLARGLCNSHYARRRRALGLDKGRVQTYVKAGGVSPDGPPRRSIAPNGYVRLTWKVGERQYVACYEHRHVMGHPHGEVHHINGDKTDNRPENLQVLAPEVHRHVHEDYPWEEIAALYTAGSSTERIAADYGTSAATISRLLRRHGVQMRTQSEAQRLRHSA